MKSSIVIGDVLIQYYFYPAKGAKTVLFLHGWRSDGSVWNDIAKKLHTEKYSVYALDLPGFGGSPIPKTSFTVSEYVDTVIGFMEKMNMRNVVLIGHSFGGRIAIKLASSHPKQVKKLVLVDSACFTNPSKQRMKYAAKLVKPLFSFSFMQGLRSKIYSVLGASDYLATPFLRKTLVNVIEEDLSESLPHINSPTLLIWGEDDRETPLSGGKKIADQIRGSRLEILSGAGHYSFLDKPSEFYQVFEKFLK